MSRYWRSQAAPPLRPALHLDFDGHDDGPVLLFIHDLGESLHAWDRVVDILREDFRLIRVDLPGHGKSAPRPQEYDVRAAALAVAERVRGTGRYTVVGHGLGGQIALELALVREVEGLILVQMLPAPSARGSRTRPSGSILWSGAIGRRMIPDALQRHRLAAGLAADAGVSDGAVADARRVAWRTWQGWRHASHWHLSERISLIERLKRVEKPKLAIWGSQDPLWGSDLAGGFTAAGAEVATIDSSGRCLPREAPESMASLIATFVDRQAAPSSLRRSATVGGT